MTTENNNETEAQTTETKVSDSKLILAPLARYAGVALIMVGVIISAAMMLDRGEIDIDQHLASIDSSDTDSDSLIAADDESTTTAATMAQQSPESGTLTDIPLAAVSTDNSTAAPTSPEAVAAPSASADAPVVTETAAETTIEAADHTVIAENNTPDATISNKVVSDNTQAVASAAPPAASAQTPAPLALNQQSTTGEPSRTRPDVFSHRSMSESHNTFRQARLAEHNAYMKQRDSKNLEDFRASQLKMIDMMKQQLGHQQEIIDQMREHYLSVYGMREAAMKRMQQARESRFERI